MITAAKKQQKGRKRKQTAIIENRTTMIADYAQRSQFTDKESLYTSEQKWLADHKSYFTKTELMVAKTIVRMCAGETIGIFLAKRAYIQKCVGDNFGRRVSISSIKRAVKKMIEVGMLVVQERLKGYIEGKRRNYQTSNLYIFQAYRVTVKRVRTLLKTLVVNALGKKQELSENYKMNHRTTFSDKDNKNIYIRIPKPSKLLNFVPKTFQKLVGVFNMTDKQIHRLYQVAFYNLRVKSQKTNTFKPLFDPKTEENILAESVDLLRVKMKQQNISNMFAYYNGIVYKLVKKEAADILKVKEMPDKHPLPFGYVWWNQ